MLEKKRIFYSNYPREIIPMNKALKYLPDEVLESLKDRLTILSMTGRKASRLSRGLCESSEIIIVSEKIYPPQDMHESHSDFRYFVFIVLHEIAHAYLEHKCQVYDKISDKEKQKQEDEADCTAATWYNQYAEKNPSLGLHSITDDDKTEFRGRK